MQPLWTLIAEIETEPGDLDLEPEYNRGFMRVVIRGEDEQSIRTGLAEYLGTFRWKLLSAESLRMVNRSDEEEVAFTEMIERAGDNPRAIILGTFHAYGLENRTTLPSRTIDQARLPSR